jgi:plastocyanin
MSCSGEPPFAPARSRLEAASHATRRAAVLPRLLAPAVVLAGATTGLDTGTIIGRVRLVSVDSVAAVALAYSSRRITAPGPPVRDIRNVVVFVRGTPVPVRTAIHEMRQQNEVFRPRVLPVTVGSTVSFPNAHPFFHNVFSLSGGAAFDRGRYPPGQSRTRVFDEPGLVKVLRHWPRVASPRSSSRSRWSTDDRA